jgi:dsRNA-specific ribonuclease
VGGINCTVICLEKVGEYAETNQAEYSAMVCDAYPLMNELLLAHLKNYVMGEEALMRFTDELDRSLSIAESLAQDNDYVSAAYTLMQKLLDYSVLSSDGIFNYETLEEYACGKGIENERFRKLYGAYESQRKDTEPSYKASSADVEALFGALNCLKTGKEQVKEAGVSSDYAAEIEMLKRSLDDCSGGAP